MYFLSFLFTQSREYIRGIGLLVLSLQNIRITNIQTLEAVYRMQPGKTGSQLIFIIYTFPNVNYVVSCTSASGSDFIPYCHVLFVFTARCTIMQSTGLQQHVVRLSVRLSVHPSVTLMDSDRIGWKFWKLITRKITPTPSLFIVHKPPTLSQGNMGKFGEDQRWVGKSGVLEYKRQCI